MKDWLSFFHSAVKKVFNDRLRSCMVFLGTAFPLEVVHPGLKGLQAEGNLIFSPAQSLHCCTALVDSKKFRIQLKFSAEWTTSLSGKLKIIVKLCFANTCLMQH